MDFSLRKIHSAFSASVYTISENAIARLGRVFGGIGFRIFLTGQFEVADGAFGFEELAFAVDAPAVAGEGAADADYSVAGDEERDAVEGAGAGYGAGGFGVAHFAGQLRVGFGVAAGNLAEGLPDTELEDGAAEIEGIIFDAGTGEVVAVADAG